MKTTFAIACRRIWGKNKGSTITIGRSEGLNWSRLQKIEKKKFKCAYRKTISLKNGLKAPSHSITEFGKVSTQSNSTWKQFFFWKKKKKDWITIFPLIGEIKLVSKECLWVGSPANPTKKKKNWFKTKKKNILLFSFWILKHLFKNNYRIGLFSCLFFFYHIL